MEQLALSLVYKIVLLGLSYFLTVLNFKQFTHRLCTKQQVYYSNSVISDHRGGYIVVGCLIAFILFLFYITCGSTAACIFFVEASLQ